MCRAPFCSCCEEVVKHDDHLSCHSIIDSQSLLGSSLSSSTSTTTDELVGRICVVRGHDEAVLCTGKPVFFCFCFPWVCSTV
jgi:hypothetical protein